MAYSKNRKRLQTNRNKKKLNNSLKSKRRTKDKDKSYKKNVNRYKKTLRKKGKSRNTKRNQNGGSLTHDTYTKYIGETENIYGYGLTKYEVVKVTPFGTEQKPKVLTDLGVLMDIEKKYLNKNPNCVSKEEKDGFEERLEYAKRRSAY